MVKQGNQRDEFLAQLTDKILAAQNDKILRVAINGVDGSGKTRLADEIALLLMAQGAHVIRASIDGFHNPRIMRYAKGRNSPEGFYHDSFNISQFKSALLDPLSPNGNLAYRTVTFDHVTDNPIDMPVQKAQTSAILLVDGIFLFTNELKGYFDLKIFLDVPFEVSYARMAVRDGTPPNPNAAENMRYLDGQKLYFAQCNPQQQADILIDYSDLESPVIL